MIISKLFLFFAVSTIVCTSCNKEKFTETTIVSENRADNATTTLASTSNVVVKTISGKLDDRGNAQDGNGSNARFWNPTKMVYDSRNNMLYVADGSAVRSIDAQNNVSTYVPLNTVGNSFVDILDIDVAPGTGGTLYLTTDNNELWKIEPVGGTSQ